MTEKGRDDGGGTPSAGKTLWVYGYEMIPPHPEERMTAIRALLDRENEAADREARTWKARLVTESHATHVMIVSASPEPDPELHRKLKAELSALGVRFLPTGPMSVRDEDGAEAVGMTAPGQS